MRKISRWITAGLTCVSTCAFAEVSSYNGATGVLTIPAVKVGATTYINVTLGNAGNFIFNLLGATEQAQPPTADDASYDAGTAVLSIPSVKVGAATYVGVTLRNTGNYVFSLLTATEQHLPPSPARVSAGLTFAVARLANGSLQSWGANFFGELGGGTNRRVPGPVALNASVVMHSSGAQHTIAVITGGTVMGWGSNNNGQLGSIGVMQQDTPVALPGVSNAVSACAGGAHTLVRLSGGTVVALGRNDSGQLGIGTTSNSAQPTPVVGIGNAIAVACGSTHSIALLADGTVRTWGRNNRGQLGDGGAVNQPAPVAVPGLTKVIAIAAGFEHSVALRDDGSVWTWGYNAKGQLGDGAIANRNQPFATSLTSGMTRIAAGGYNTMALRNDSVLLVWGTNNFGQLGNGTVSPTFSSTPVAVPGLTNVADMAVGHHPDTSTLFAVRSDGTTYGWGNNTDGQVGNGSANSVALTPQQVVGLNLN